MENLVIERLREIVFKYYKSGANMAKQLDLPQTTVNRYLNDRTPNFEFLQKLLSSNREINPYWLILGEGEMKRTVAGNTQTGRFNQIGEVNEQKVEYKSGDSKLMDEKNKTIERLEKEVEFLRELLRK